MNYEIEGVLILKGDEQQISATFKKREFVIEVENERDPAWNDFVKFEITQDRCSKIDVANIRDKIKVSFNVRGRKWEKNGQVNYFNFLEAWNIDVLEGASKTAPAEKPKSQKPIPQPVDDDGENDLPF